MAAINGVIVGGTLVPTDSEDTYPVIDPKFGIGGYREVADNTERDNIPSGRKRAGMLVYSLAEDKVYKLSADETTWDEFNSGGGGNGSIPVYETKYNLPVDGLAPPVGSLAFVLADDNGENALWYYDSNGGGEGIAGWVSIKSILPQSLSDIPNTINTEFEALAVWIDNYLSGANGYLPLNGGDLTGPTTLQVDIDPSIEDNYAVPNVGWVRNLLSAYPSSQDVTDSANYAVENGQIDWDQIGYKVDGDNNNIGGNPGDARGLPMFVNNAVAGRITGVNTIADRDAITLINEGMLVYVAETARYYKLENNASWTPVLKNTLSAELGFGSELDFDFEYQTIAIGSSGANNLVIDTFSNEGLGKSVRLEIISHHAGDTFSLEGYTIRNSGIQSIIGGVTNVVYITLEPDNVLRVTIDPQV